MKEGGGPPPPPSSQTPLQPPPHPQPHPHPPSHCLIRYLCTPCDAKYSLPIPLKYQLPMKAMERLAIHIYQGRFMHDLDKPIAF